MRQVYLIPNIITAFGLACGLFVIFKVNMVEPGSSAYHLLLTSALLLLVASLADFFDGAIARLMGAESEFGFLFDTLADAVSFGVAPSVLLLKSLSLEHGTGFSFFAVVGAMLFSICGILRLVRFNVNASQAKGNEDAMAASKKHFTGLPIPAAALAAVSANLFLSSSFAERYMPMSDYLHALVLISLMILLGYLMVSRWKFPSAKSLHFRVPSFQLVFFTAIFAIFILYGILYFFPVIFALVTWVYILLGLILAIIRKIAGRKSKTLEEFEPDEEEPDDDDL